MGRNDEIVSESANIAKTADAPNIAIASVSGVSDLNAYENDVDDTELVTGQMLGSLTLSNDNNQSYQKKSADVQENLLEPHVTEVERDGLENLAEFIAFKLQKKENIGYIPSTDETSFSWVNHLSEDGLLKPNEDFLTKCTELDHIFNSFNGDSLKLTKHYLSSLMELANSSDLSTEAKHFFSGEKCILKLD